MKILDSALNRVILAVLLAGIVSEATHVNSGYSDSNSKLFGIVFVGSYLILSLISLFRAKKEKRVKEEKQDVIDSDND